ncbi:MAG: hypothetical protein IJY82_00180 [Oscillospiraceae bacterium]|nr:hypothetical protein [Oscillospiraceae bacterium]
MSRSQKEYLWILGLIPATAAMGCFTVGCYATLFFPKKLRPQGMDGFSAFFECLFGAYASEWRLLCFLAIPLLIALPAAYAVHRALRTRPAEKRVLWVGIPTACSALPMLALELLNAKGILPEFLAEHPQFHPMQISPGIAAGMITFYAVAAFSAALFCLTLGDRAYRKYSPKLFPLFFYGGIFPAVFLAFQPLYLLDSTYGLLQLGEEFPVPYIRQKVILFLGWIFAEILFSLLLALGLRILRSIVRGVGGRRPRKENA